MIPLRRFARRSSVCRSFVRAALFAAVAAASPLRGQVLEQVPADALAVLKVNHLGDTSRKLADLMQALGVTDFVPAMSDPLGAFQQQTGMQAGIDKNGDAAAAWLNKPWTPSGGNDSPPPLVILVPVTDYKAFVSQSSVVRTEGDVTVVHFKQDPDQRDTFIAEWGKYAAVSPVKECVATKPTTSLKPTGLAAKELDEKDAVLYANFPALKEVLSPKLDAAQQKAMTEIDKALDKKGGDAAANKPLADAALGQAFNVISSFLRDASGGTYGISLGKSGVNTTLLADFKEGSYLGSLASKLKGSDAPLLGGLPDQKYLFFGGSFNDPAVATKVFEDLLNPITAKLDTLGDKAKPIRDALDSYRTMAAATQRQTYGIVAPTAAIGQGSLLQFITLLKGDAAKLHEAAVDQQGKQQAMMNALGLNAAQASAVKTTITRDAKTVDGVKFDQAVTQFNFQGNTPQEMQAQQAMNVLYGPNGLSILTGEVDPKTVLGVGGADDALLAAAVASAKTDADVVGGSDSIKAVDGELPKNRVLVAYIPLDVIVGTGVSYARQFGFPMNFQLPPNLPPIGVNGGGDGSAFRIDSHIPTQLVQSLIQAGMQVYLQMHNGANGGANGL